jgi:hypothetical protein
MGRILRILVVDLPEVAKQPIFQHSITIHFASHLAATVIEFRLFVCLPIFR